MLLKLYESIGFKKEGTLVNHCFYNGSYENIIRMAIFQTDWLNEK